MASPQPICIEQALKCGVREAHEGGRCRAHGQLAQQITLLLGELRWIHVVRAVLREGRSMPITIKGCTSARTGVQLGRMGRRRSRSLAGQTGIAKYGAPGGAPIKYSIPEVIMVAGAVDLARPSAGFTMLLGAMVGKAAFCNERPVKLALQDAHGCLGDGVLVASVAPELHRRPGARGLVCLGARICSILTMRILLVQHREEIFRGGAVLLHRECFLQAAPLCGSDTVARAHVWPSAKQN